MIQPKTHPQSDPTLGFIKVMFFSGGNIRCRFPVPMAGLNQATITTIRGET